MRDVFISHVEEDAHIALAIARGLNAAGYSTWCYEDDSDPGPSYLSQIDEEIEATQAVVLIISPGSLSSRQVVKEVVRAHEAGKPFIPLRRGVAHEAVHQQRDFRMALGASVSIAMPDDGVDAILPRVIRGLERSGVTPHGSVSRPPHAPPAPPPRPKPATVLSSINAGIERIADRASDSTRIGVATAVGVLGAIASSGNAMRAMSPTGEEAFLYRLSSAIGTANLWGNGVLLALNLALLYSVWQLFRGNTAVRPRIRLITSLMLISIAVWFVLVMSSALSLRSDVRMAVIGGTITAALIATVPTFLVRYLFRR